MQVHYGTARIETPRPVVTIGSFDGVHLGHISVIKALNARARAFGGESVIITFEPHPREVLYPDEPKPGILTTLPEKRAVLEACGVDHLVVLNFTPAFARLSYEDFVRQVLVERIGVRGLVMGYDHHFGYERAGNFERLQELSRRYGFFLEREAVFEADSENVSSTKIRQALAEGNVVCVTRFLGRPYSFTGKVVAGSQLGRQLGFPTANLVVDDARKLLPARGVYAVRVRLTDGRVLGGMLNVGTRPTVASDESELTLEVHLFDFSGDLYGSMLSVHLVAHLRAEQPFPSLSSLQVQLQQDQLAALRELTKE